MVQQKYSLAEIKEHLMQQPALRFKGLVAPEEKSPKQFLKNFFEYNKTYDTVYLNNKEQCKHGKRRSIGDIFRIVYHYYPKTSLTKLYRNLLALVGEGKALSSICEATGLRVYRATKGDESYYFNGVKTDEYHVDLTQFEEIKKCKSMSGLWGYDFKEDKINFIEL